MNREEQIKKEICDVFSRIPEDIKGYKIVLFGSRAAGTATPRSDYDIGVYGEHRLPIKTFSKIQDMLDDIDTLYSIDWVDLNDVSDAFRSEAMKNIEVLYG